MTILRRQYSVVDIQIEGAAISEFSISVRA